MATLQRLAIIGNSLPRRCGIATFTTDLQQSIAATTGDPHAAIIAMTDQPGSYDYPPTVGFEIHQQAESQYLRAAHFINAGEYDAISLQHEFGIFGGPAGEFIVPLLQRLRTPVITTLHSVIAEPDVHQRRVLEKVIAASARVVVMAEKGRQLLASVYGAPAAKVVVIPHGVPDFPFESPAAAKDRLGFTGKTVILTFGLLSPNKGVEVMIDAMPAILEHCPDAVYVVLGATHPTLVRDQGEAYRDALMARVAALGIEANVVFFNQFADKDTLLEFIAMCDVYVTPYLSEAQMTSGTLAYSFGLGKAIVSTPYWHARELLANGRGILVPFRDSGALSTAITSLLTNDALRLAMRERAYALSRPMIWARTAERYRALFESVMPGLRTVSPPRPLPAPAARKEAVLPDVKLTHFLSMCDDTGLFQHAVHSVPDRSHGYCVDDNARALMLACALTEAGESPLPDMVTATFAAFVQHAWNPDLRRFRNFMGFDRRWLEPFGSEDSHGRTLWALGYCARHDSDPSRRSWASHLFLEALPALDEFRSPRAWAFGLLGLDAFCARHPGHHVAEEMRRILADQLLRLMADIQSHDWDWFEAGLSYDNARLPQALIATGLATDSATYRQAGLTSLRWLMRQQSTPSGLFRPIGTDGFGQQRSAPMAFDQQPVEAAASIAACLAAHRAQPKGGWIEEAVRAFNWFLGANDLSVPLADVATGSCRDGLHSDRANENRGGESVLSYLLGLVEIRSAVGVRSKLKPLLATHVSAG